MNGIASVQTDLDRVFQRRIYAAPTDVRQAFAGRGHLVNHSWLLDGLLLMLVGNRSDINAAIRREKSFSTPFPRLFGQSSAIMEAGIATAAFDFSFNLSEHDQDFAVKMQAEGSLMLRNIGVILSSSSDSYDVSLLFAYQARSNDDAVLFGPDEMDARITRWIRDRRLRIRATDQG